jgi:uncharacterized protein YjbI with pentapeptide repeats
VTRVWCTANDLPNAPGKDGQNPGDSAQSITFTVTVGWLTDTIVSSSADPSAFGKAVTFTATVSARSPTYPVDVSEGTVTFTDGATTLAANVPVSSGQASITMASLSPGNHAIVASYSGYTAIYLFDNDLYPSVSLPLGQTVTNCRSAFAGCRMVGADFTNANLAGESFNGANLSGANFSGANLTGTPLRGANLSGANFSGANLGGADLRSANLSGANFSVANLIGAHLTGARLTGVTWSNTTCPDGTNSNAHGGTCSGHL